MAKHIWSFAVRPLPNMTFECILIRQRVASNGIFKNRFGCTVLSLEHFWFYVLKRFLDIWHCEMDLQNEELAFNPCVIRFCKKWCGTSLNLTNSPGELAHTSQGADRWKQFSLLSLTLVKVNFIESFVLSHFRINEKLFISLKDQIIYGMCDQCNDERSTDSVREVCNQTNINLPDSSRLVSADNITVHTMSWLPDLTVFCLIFC